MRVTGVVVVLVTEPRTVVRDVRTVAGAVVGAAVAVATGAAAAAAGWSGAFVTCRCPLAKMVIAPKLLSVIAVASVRSARVEATRGFLARRGGRAVM